MAYTPPPTFVDGQPASAAALNVLRDDIQWLYGIAQAPNPAMMIVRQEGSWFTGPEYFAMRHKHQYLRFRIQARWWASDSANNPNVRAKIYVSNQQALVINWFNNTPAPTTNVLNGDGTRTKTWDTYITLASVSGFAVNVGQVYEVKLIGVQESDGEAVPESGYYECTYHFESDSTT